MPAIPVLGKLKQEDHEFKASPRYIRDPVSKRKQEIEGACSLFPPCEAKQKVTSVRNMALIRHHICWSLDLELSSLQNHEEVLLLINYPVQGILLHQPKWTKTICQRLNMSSQNFYVEI
jgi:hypothetical protein